VTRPTILLTGAGGQVGFELQRSLAPHGDVTACDHSKLDLGDRDALVDAVRSLRPQLIVNAAAYTAVDRAEGEVARAEAINTTAPGILAEEARRIDAVLVHFSTDYVFDGAGSVPYDERAPTAPLNVYGRTKRDGEDAIVAVGGAHLILRTSWVYGLRGGNFLLTMLRLAAERDELRIVADQFGAPTWARDLAHATAAALGCWKNNAWDQNLSGLYHLTAAGRTNWHQYAEEIVRQARKYDSTLAAKPLKINAIATHEYPVPAKRPVNSVLANEKIRDTFGIVLPAWQDSVAECVRELYEQAPA
jgi:dTDP-4-dehydrorhamnose reductase